VKSNTVIETIVTASAASRIYSRPQAEKPPPTRHTTLLFAGLLQRLNFDSDDRNNNY